MTGWRIGYAAGPEPLVAAINKLQSQMSSCPSSVSQAAAALTQLTEDQIFVTESVKVYKERRDYACARLNAIPGVSTSRRRALYLFLNCSGVIGRKTPEGKVIENDLDFVLYLLDMWRRGTARSRLWPLALFPAVDCNVDGGDQGWLQPYRGRRRGAPIVTLTRGEGIAPSCLMP